MELVDITVLETVAVRCRSSSLLLPTKGATTFKVYVWQLHIKISCEAWLINLRKETKGETDKAPQAMANQAKRAGTG